MDVVFRVDSSSEMGMGHLSRCLSLAAGLKEFGWTVSFISKKLHGSRLDLITERGFLIHSFDSITIEEDRQSTIEILQRHFKHVKILIVDSYHIDFSWEEQVRSFVDKILVIDDAANRPHYCDYLLDQNPGAQEQDYIHLVPSNTKLMLGPHYALLDKHYFSKRISLEGSDVSNCTDVTDVFICFGGSDPKAMTQKILDIVSACPLELTYHVVIGKSNIYRNHLIEQHYPKNIKLYDQVDNLSDIMSLCQIAIGSGGVTALERCCLGIPSIIMITAENQVRQVDSIVHSSAASFLDLNSDNFTLNLIELLNSYTTNQELFVAHKNRARSLCDGAGIYRVITQLFSGNFFSSADWYLRPASIHDAEVILTWQQFPGARKYSRNQNPPTKEEHYAWMEKYLSSNNIMLLIIYNNNPVGFIRLDVSHYLGCGYEISILISSGFQGIGIATAVLSCICQIYSSYKLYAKVMPTNKASVAIFKKNGFIEHEEGEFIYAS